MKKSFLFFFAFIFLLGLAGCSVNESTESFLFEGSYTGNYIASPLITLAWDELKNDVIRDDIRLGTNSKALMKNVEFLNNYDFEESEIPEDDYFIAANYGSGFRDQVLLEHENKFSDDKSFAFEKEITEKEIGILSYFNKQVIFPYQFQVAEVKFMGEEYRGFLTNGQKQRQYIKIIDLQENKFILEIALDGSADKMFVAKGYGNDTPDSVLRIINSNVEKEDFKDSDLFAMPNVKFDYVNDYADFMGEKIGNAGFNSHHIALMRENIRLSINNAGVHVDNSSISADLADSKRMFLLDEPFWIIFKKDDASEPYLTVGINNDLFLEENEEI